jgi:hypothetical protein
MDARNGLSRSACLLRIAFLLLTAALASMSIAGCGSGSVTPPPNPPGNSHVTLLLTSSANDKLTGFDIALESVNLIDSGGNSVPLYSNTNAYLGSTNPEFMHLNGSVEPLATATIQQGTYTSTQVTTFGCAFTTLGVSSSGGIEISTYAQGLCGQGTGSTTVNLPQPIVISGPSVALTLDLQVSQSYTLTTPGAPGVYTISPAFNLSRIPVAAKPTNDQDGKITAITAQVTSVDETNNSMQVEDANGAVFGVATDANTSYQGISGFSTLTQGVLANLDLVIQPDGSFVATRIEVDDQSAPALIVGSWLTSDNGGQPDNWSMQPVELINCTTSPPICGGVFHNTDATVFGVSQQFSNLASLPFQATFTSSTNFAGQNLGAYEGLAFDSNAGEAVSTLMLEPQTIDGTVSAMTTQNGFSLYTVQLASYDPIVTLESIALEPPLNTPSQVVVYVDNNTQLLNSLPVNNGSLLRFRGLIFNDNGTLRMDCSEVLDGVAQ